VAGLAFAIIVALLVGAAAPFGAAAASNGRVGNA
jgi:hypothetical protein